MNENDELLIDDLVDAVKDVERSDGGIGYHSAKDTLRQARDAIRNRFSELEKKLAQVKVVGNKMYEAYVDTVEGEWGGDEYSIIDSHLEMKAWKDLFPESQPEKDV